MNKRVHEVRPTAISVYKFDLNTSILEVENQYQRYMKTKEIQRGNLNPKYINYELKEVRILMYKDIFYVPNL